MRNKTLNFRKIFHLQIGRQMVFLCDERSVNPSIIVECFVFESWIISFFIAAYSVSGKKTHEIKLLNVIEQCFTMTVFYFSFIQTLVYVLMGRYHLKEPKIMTGVGKERFTGFSRFLSFIRKWEKQCLFKTSVKPELKCLLIFIVSASFSCATSNTVSWKI